MFLFRMSAQLPRTRSNLKGKNKFTYFTNDKNKIMSDYKGTKSKNSNETKYSRGASDELQWVFVNKLTK